LLIERGKNKLCGQTWLNAKRASGMFGGTVTLLAAEDSASNSQKYTNAQQRVATT
jgi:hypothetical protein